MHEIKLPGFTAESSTQRSGRIYHRRPAVTARGSLVVPQASYHHGCCGNGCCDDTFCLDGEGAELTCNPDGSCDMSCKGCFLSEACTSALGLPDDCHELTVLRRFRDSYLMTFPLGRQMVAEYYLIAPRMCQHIGCRDDANQVYHYLYNDLVQPSVEMIEAKKYTDAWEYYRRFTLSLRQNLEQPKPR